MAESLSNLPSAGILLAFPVLAFWSTIESTNERYSKPAVLAYATIVTDRVAVRGIRNFDYRSETDVIAAYYDGTFNLRDLRSVDAFSMEPILVSGKLALLANDPSGMHYPLTEAEPIEIQHR